MSSDSIPIPRSNKRNIEICVDFDFDTLEDMEKIIEKATQIGETVSINQISTQSNVISMCGRNRRGTFPHLTVNTDGEVSICDLKGGQFFIPQSLKFIKVVSSDTSRYPLVLSEIRHPVVFDFDCRISQLTITKCKGVVVRMKRAPIAGIECIESESIRIDAQNCNFIRTTTSFDVKFRGECDETVLLDVRNCVDIEVNKNSLNVGMFTVGKFSFSPQDKSFVPIHSTDDTSSINLALLKK